MYTTLAEVALGDVDTFIGVFATRGAKLRIEHGSRRADVWVSREEPRTGYVMIDWDSRESFERFRADPTVPATMASGGIKGPPRFIAVEKLAVFPG